VPEIGRVLRAGRLLILTATRERVRCYWLNAYFSKDNAAPIAQMPSQHSCMPPPSKRGFAS
jgi:hypothetical protein